MAAKRLEKERAQLEIEVNDQVVLTCTDNLLKWNGLLRGPSGTPYEGGEFTLHIDVPEAYPLQPPTVVFTSRIYHMNVTSPGGLICLPSLLHNWDPSRTLNSIMMDIFELLINPDPESSVVPEITQCFNTDRATHDKIATCWTEIYARPDTRRAAKSLTGAPSQTSAAIAPCVSAVAGAAASGELETGLVHGARPERRLKEAMVSAMSAQTMSSSSKLILEQENNHSPGKISDGMIVLAGSQKRDPPFEHGSVCSSKSRSPGRTRPFEGWPLHGTTDSELPTGRDRHDRSRNDCGQAIDGDVRKTRHAGTEEPEWRSKDERFYTHRSSFHEHGSFDRRSSGRDGRVTTGQDWRSHTRSDYEKVRRDGESDHQRGYLREERYKEHSPPPLDEHRAFGYTTRYEPYRSSDREHEMYSGRYDERYEESYDESCAESVAQDGRRFRHEYNGYRSEERPYPDSSASRNADRGRYKYDAEGRRQFDRRSEPHQDRRQKEGADTSSDRRQWDRRYDERDHYRESGRVDRQRGPTRNERRLNNRRGDYD